MISTDVADFQQIVWEYFSNYGRDLPWRTMSANPEVFPYQVLISEFMLQQTQVSRVIDKFQQWLVDYPTIHDVASATQADIITSWNGLGYNRRAKYVHETCQKIVKDNQGIVPSDENTLVSMPGIGHNTAAAIQAYAYNVPSVFIETNIRTVFIYHFFEDRYDITDSEILPLIATTINGNPREWYWALMDYGTFLKKNIGNMARRSKHHTKQSVFEGSRRQLRGMIIRQLIHGACDMEFLVGVSSNDTRLAGVLEDLIREKLIVKTGVKYQLAGE